MFARDPTFTPPVRNVANSETVGLWRRIYPDLLLLIPLSESFFSLGLCWFILKTWYQPTVSVTLLEFKLIARTHRLRLPSFVCFTNNCPLLICVHSDVPLFELIYWLILELLCMHVEAWFVFSGVVWRAEHRTRHWLMGLGCIPFLRSILHPCLSDNSNLLSEVYRYLHHPFPPLQNETSLSSRLSFWGD